MSTCLRLAARIAATPVKTRTTPYRLNCTVLGPRVRTDDYVLTAKYRAPVGWVGPLRRVGPFFLKRQGGGPRRFRAEREIVLVIYYLRAKRAIFFIPLICFPRAKRDFFLFFLRSSKKKSDP